MKSYNVVVKDGEVELANRRLDAVDSGNAADIVLDEIKHPEETRLVVEVREIE